MIYSEFMKNEELRNFKLPAYREIPDVGLYLDQVAKYINSYLQDFPEMDVTPSMISNYAKAKLIDRINKKTYTREQISCLIFIVLSKTVLSITNIRMILEEIHTENNDMEKSYAYFRNCVETLLGSMNDEDASPAITAEGETEQMLKNIAIAVAHKMYLEHYFETKRKTQEA